MGLMDMLGSAVSGGSGGAGGQGSMVETVMGLVNQSGGVQGLVEKLKAAGLGKQVESWVGTGQNLPVSGDQIKSALGHETVNNLAQQAGLSPDATANGLAEHLPSVIDSLSPQGALPHGDLKDQALAMLKSKFFG